MLLIVASWDAERNEATSEPAADEAKNKTEDPGESALVLSNACHTGMLAELTRDCDGVVGPVGSGIRTSDSIHNDHLARLSHHWLSIHRLHTGLHHGLTWLLDRHSLAGSHHTRLLLHGGLSVARLGHRLLGSVLRLSHRLRGILRLPRCHHWGSLATHKRLLIGSDLAHSGVTDLRFFAVHACYRISIINK